jgi:allene oxide cyclase
MKRTPLIFAAAVAVVAAAAFVAQARTVGHRAVGRSSTTVHVIEHATTDTTVDVGPSGDSTGDILTFSNDVFDETNTTKVGRDQGECTRINVVDGSWECHWITFLKGGAITVEGPFFDTKSSVLPITGGRGKFKDASGSMKLSALASGTEYDFVFTVRQ